MMKPALSSRRPSTKDGIIQQGKENGLSGDDSKVYAVDSMTDHYYNRIITSHEGQHALDAQFLRTSAIAEYR
jgi:hypothetical protein